MSDIVKWGILGALLVTLVIIILNNTVFVAMTDFLNDSGVGDIVSEGLSVVGGFLIIGRQLLNNFFYPPALTAALVFSFGMFILYTIIRVATFVARFVYK